MFDLQRGTPIVFYGYSQFDTVKNKYQDMHGLGYQVLGYLDQNAHGLNRDQVTSWTIQEFPYSMDARKNIAVILLLQNGRIHEDVAGLLHDNGFEKILFLPRNGDTAKKKSMIRLYNAFLKSEYDALRGIPGWQELQEAALDVTVLQKGEVYRTVYVPVELLFEYAREPGKESSLCFSEIYNEIFDFLEGERTTCDSYCAFMGAKTREASDQLLSSRMELYCFWEQQRHNNIQYFVDAAPIAAWNEKGYFNLVDGHHRAMYLLRKGYRKIPVAMTHKDFHCWETKIHIKGFEKLRTLRIPKLLPGFLNEACMYEPHWRQVLRYLYRIGRQRPCRLVEVDDYMGYYASLFQRMVKRDAAIVTGNETNTGLCVDLLGCAHQDIDFVKMDELRIEADDILYLKIDGKESDTAINLMREAGCRHMLIDLPENFGRDFLAGILGVEEEDLITVCKYYREKTFVVLALERRSF